MSVCHPRAPDHSIGQPSGEARPYRPVPSGTVTNRWLGVLAPRDFRLYFIGRATSFIGTGMLPVALSFAILGRGGSTSEVGWVLSADVFPLALFLLVAGVIADRVNRRAVMLS